jgi:hypothetical protein
MAPHHRDQQPQHHAAKTWFGLGLAWLSREGPLQLMMTERAGMTKELSVGRLLAASNGR